MLVLRTRSDEFVELLKTRMSFSSTAASYSAISSPIKPTICYIVSKRILSSLVGRNNIHDSPRVTRFAAVARALFRSADAPRHVK